MIYVEASRTIEPHTECILFLYLQDANGVPVSFSRIKLWADPPSEAGLTHELGDDPTRRTDAGGKFEMVVSPSVSPQALNFYLQVTDPNGAPESEPIQFHFPANEAQWVTVILRAESTPTDMPSTAESALKPILQDEPPVGSHFQEISPPSLSSEIPVGTAPEPEPTPALVSQPEPEPTSPVVEPLPAPPTPSGLPPPPVSRPETPTVAITQKAIAHYLLFGPSSERGTLTNLILALDYIIRFTPTVGFSVADARFAQHVTIVGDTNAVGEDAEQGLRDMGCLVTRLTAPDSYALENLFRQLIASGSPFPS